MVRAIDRENAKKYLNKAEEFLSESKDALLNSRFNAAGFNAIQSIINANDALTIFTIGKRASKDHREAIKMHIETIRVTHDSSNKQILKDALNLRSEVGYSGKLTNKDLANKLIRDANNFVEWIKKYVK
jgi:uncharacterized protein (UPF0332 family)